MNPEYEIYRASEADIPSEDKARLDGFLAAKADETEIASMKRKFEDLLRKAEQTR